MPEPEEELRMITVWMSDFVVNTGFYILHKHGYTNIVVTDDMVRKSLRLQF
jgi:hypothetical protein